MDKFEIRRMSTLNGILMREEAIIKSGGLGLLNSSRKTLKKGINENVDSEVYRWILETRQKNGYINSDNIIEKAKRIAQKNNDNFGDRFKRGWFQGFNDRFNLKYITFHGEAGSVSEHTVTTWKEKLCNVLEKWSPADVVNIDEIGLCYQQHKGFYLKLDDCLFFS